MKIHKFTLILFSILMYQAGLAQNVLSRKEMVEKALANSYRVKKQEHKVEEAKLSKEKVWNTYLPKVGVDAAYLRMGTEVTIKRDISDITHQLQSGAGEAMHAMQGNFQQYLKDQAQAAAAKGDYALAQALQNPQTQALLGATQNYLTQSSQQLTGLLPNQLGMALRDQNLWFVDAHIDMVIFSGLQVPTMAKAAQEKMYAQEALVEKEKQAVMIETLMYFDKLAVIRQSEAVLTEMQSLLQEKRKFVEKAIENGLATQFDRTKIGIAEKNIEANLIKLSGGQSLVLSKLEQLTGVEKEALQALSPTLDLWHIQAEESNLQNRPELKALKHSINALSQVHKSEKYSYLPKAKAFAHLAKGGSNLTEIDPVWFVGVGLKWEIFDGMQRKKDIQHSKLQVESMQLQKEETENLIALEFEKNYTDWQVKTQLVQVAEEKANEAHNALTIKDKEFENGLATTPDLIESQTEYEKAQLEHIQRLFEQRQSTAQLLRAMGILSLEQIQ
ncbi:TolC family protein [Rapidithrix thailandica]|uniref:TolC family protein n=1 Tax=Rapidithrix thailandica TaxID=413964 RepID=A0AAW9SFW1_9BACT